MDPDDEYSALCQQMLLTIYLIIRVMIINVLVDEAEMERLFPEVTFNAKRLKNI